MAEKRYLYVVSATLVRDPGVPDKDLVRSLSDWKRLKDGGSEPPQWGGKAAPRTLRGFLCLLARADVPEAMTMLEINHRSGANAVDYVAMFEAPPCWADVLAQALSSMAYGLRPGTEMTVSCRRGGTSRSRLRTRTYGIVLNGDGEPEVEEDADA